MGTNNAPVFLPGTLDMLVLKTLSRGAMHGYSIAQFIQQASSDVLKVEARPSLATVSIVKTSPRVWGSIRRITLF